MRRFAAGLVAVALVGCGGSPADVGETEGAATDTPTPAATKHAATTIVADAAFLTDVQVDSTALYWANNSGEVWSVPLAGGAATQLAATNDADEFPSLALAGDTVFVANGTTVASVPKAGGTLTMLATALGPTTALLLDGDSLYWATSFTDLKVANSAVINRLPVTGGSVATLASGLDAPAFLAIDDANVYWADLGAGTISAMPRAGGAVRVLVSNQVGLSGLAVHGTELYWSNFSGPAAGIVGQPPPKVHLGDGTVNAIAIAGGKTRVLAKTYFISGIAVDDSFVYWSDGHTNTISRTPLAGGASKVIVDDTVSIGPVLDGAAIYYGVILPPPQNTFAIRKIAK